MAILSESFFVSRILYAISYPIWIQFDVRFSLSFSAFLHSLKPFYPEIKSFNLQKALIRIKNYSEKKWGREALIFRKISGYALNNEVTTWLKRKVC